MDALHAWVCRILMFCTVALSSVTIAADSASANSCTARIGWEEYPPFAIAKEGSDPTGFDLDNARVMLEMVGCTVQFIPVPWSQALQDLEQGRLDLLSAATQTPERDAFALFTQPYRNEAFHLVRLVGRPDLTLQAAIGEEKRIGIVKDYYYGPMANRLINDKESAAQFEVAGNDDANLRQLESQKLDYAIIERIYFRWVSLQNQQATRFVLSRDPVSLTPLRFMVSRRSPLAARIQDINAALNAMQLDGKTAAIVARYAPEPVIR